MSFDYIVSQFEQLLLETTSERSFVSITLAKTIADCLRESELSTIIVDGSKMSSTRIDDDYLSCILESLVGANIALDCLHLPYNRITSVGVIHFLSKYICLGSLRNINLEGNDIDGEAIAYFGLSEKECPLVSLNISVNPDISAHGAMLLADGLVTNHRLKHLYASNCGFDLTTMIAIVSSLQENDTIETLELDRPLLRTTQEEQCDHLSRLLIHQGTMVTLSLKHSHIRDFGCRLIADSLTRNRSLMHLNLECNRIGVAGAEALASYLILVRNRGLESLRLSYNEVGNAGCLALAEALQTNTCLKVLTLKSNKVDTALAEMGEALYQNNTLQYLSLFGNDFNQQSGRIFYDLIGDRLSYIDLKIDVEVYHVDGNFMIAENL